MKQAQQAAADAQAAAAKGGGRRHRAATGTHRERSGRHHAAEHRHRPEGQQRFLATTVSDETASIKKAIANPDALSLQGHHALARWQLPGG